MKSSQRLFSELRRRGELSGRNEDGPTSPLSARGPAAGSRCPLSVVSALATAAGQIMVLAVIGPLLQARDGENLFLPEKIPNRKASSCFAQLSGFPRPKRCPPGS